MKASLEGVPVSTAKYGSVDDLDLDPAYADHFVTIYVMDVNEPVMKAIRYARLLGGKIVAVHILVNSSDRDRIEDPWKLNNIDIPLLILDSPNDSIIEPFEEFVEEILQRHKKSVVTILLPVIAGLKWWQRFLHNQTERLIERAFQYKAGVVTIRVPFSPGRGSNKEAQLSHLKK